MSSSVLEPAPRIFGNPDLTSPPTTPRRADGWRTDRLVMLALLVTGLKLLCAAFTLGSGDVFTFHRFAASLQTLDICSLYRQEILFNHTPLVAAYLTVLGSFDGMSMQRFAFFIRLPGILADLGLILFLLSQRRYEPIASCPRWALTLFIASPVSFLVSGFHGNFDPVVVCFLTVAAWMCVRNQPVVSGLFLALSLQVKVPALIVLPVFVIYWYRQRALGKFGLCLVAVCAVGWAEPLLRDPRVFLHNVLGYSSWWGTWGITDLLVHTGSQPLRLTPLAAPTLAQRIITQGLKLIIVSGVSWLAWTRRPFTKEKFVPTLAIAWSLFFCLTPGGCVQYLVWLAPFVLLAYPRWYGGMTLCCSLYCYMFYRIICHGWLLYCDHSVWLDYWLSSQWMLLAWVGTSYGLRVFWREDRESLRLFPGRSAVGSTSVDSSSSRVGTSRASVSPASLTELSS